MVFCFPVALPHWQVSTASWRCGTSARAPLISQRLGRQMCEEAAAGGAPLSACRPPFLRLSRPEDGAGPPIPRLHAGRCSSRVRAPRNGHRARVTLPAISSALAVARGA